MHAGMRLHRLQAAKPPSACIVCREGWTTGRAPTITAAGPAVTTEQNGAGDGVCTARTGRATPRDRPPPNTKPPPPSKRKTQNIPPTLRWSKQSPVSSLSAWRSGGCVRGLSCAVPGERRECRYKCHCSRRSTTDGRTRTRAGNNGNNSNSNNKSTSPHSQVQLALA